jgi:hypothetical protein
MKEITKMLSDLRGCLAKRFTNKKVVIIWELDGVSKSIFINFAKIVIRQTFSNGWHYDLEFQFTFTEGTSYISFYKEVLKTINNE